MVFYEGVLLGFFDIYEKVTAKEIVVGCEDSYRSFRVTWDVNDLSFESVRSEIVFVLNEYVRRELLEGASCKEEQHYFSERAHEDVFVVEHVSCFHHLYITLVHGYLSAIFLAEESAVSGVVKVSMGYQNKLEVPRSAAGVVKLSFKVFAIDRVACVDENVAFTGFYEVAVCVRNGMKSKDLDILHVFHLLLNRYYLAYEEPEGDQTDQPHEEDRDNIDQNKRCIR